jgi:hypothetical protein
VAIAGRAGEFWFWDEYGCSVSVKSQGSPVGIVFLHQDPGNYLLLRCGSESEPKDARMQLVSVLEGARTTLAEANGGIVPEQWYSLRVGVSDGHIEAYLDDRLVLTGHTDLFGQGQIGLYTEGAQGAYFDDVWAESWGVFVDDFGKQEAGKWVAVSGEWLGPQKGAVARNGPGEALLLGGDPTWTDYVYGADVTGSKRAGAGIVFRASDAGRLVFRWAPEGCELPYAGQVQLVRVVGEQATVLAEAPATLAVAETHRFEASCEGSHVALCVDGERVLECAARALLEGGIGLYADGQGRVSFDNVSVRPPKKAQAAKILPRFESPGDSTMQAWATKSGQWTAQQEQATYWHVGDFFGDKAISFEIPSVGQRTGSATITLSSDPKDPQAGYRLLVATVEGQQQVTLALYRGQERLQEGRIAVPGGQNAELRVEHRGGHILAYISGQCILAQKIGR